MKVRDPETVHAKYVRLLTTATDGRAKIQALIVPYRTGNELAVRLAAVKSRLVQPRDGFT
ncbi:hypothetical protein CW712_02125 [Candidatus Bathyarchaeota archaeon]|nr:MAG: hypothetical protein CW712_02125 [Candidatus Bathyarchaeota archaeon]